jgi:hypothetical protein
MAITITDAGGGTLGGVRVAADGPTARNGETNGSDRSTSRDARRRLPASLEGDGVGLVRERK